MPEERKLYFIAVIPPTEIADAVKEIKLEFSKNYDSSRALRSPAHITLQAPFFMHEPFECRVIERLFEFSKNIEPFQIQLKNFSSFPKRVIFIDVMENNHLKELHKDLMIFLRNHLNFSVSDTPLSFYPHMTVAYRDLEVENYVKAWKVFKDRKFSATFELKSIFLLKHNFKEWEVREELKFNR